MEQITLKDLKKSLLKYFDIENWNEIEFKQEELYKSDWLENWNLILNDLELSFWIYELSAWEEIIDTRFMYEKWNTFYDLWEVDFWNTYQEILDTLNTLEYKCN
jgi:hypothetical protein